jgi:hypothetical protein
LKTMIGWAAATVRELGRVEVGQAVIDRPNLVVLASDRLAPDNGLLPARFFAAVYVDTARREVRVAK